jgi:hypothetical protein
MPKGKKPDEIQIEVPTHLLEPDRIVLEKVAGKKGVYRVAGMASKPGSVMEGPEGPCPCPGNPSCGACEGGKKTDPVALSESLRHDVGALHTKVAELSKSIKVGFGQVHDILKKIK